MGQPRPINGTRESHRWDTAILETIKQRAGTAFRVPAINAFGRALCGNPVIRYRRSKKGSELYVKLI